MKTVFFFFLSQRDTEKDRERAIERQREIQRHTHTERKNTERDKTVLLVIVHLLLYTVFLKCFPVTKINVVVVYCSFHYLCVHLYAYLFVKFPNLFVFLVFSYFSITSMERLILKKN